MSAASPAERTLLQSELQDGIAALGLSLPEAAPGQLLDFLDLIRRWNKVYNLTAIREPHEMLRQHLLDSLAVLPAFDLRAEVHLAAGAGPFRVLDVGSGAGLPGVVLAIARPHWRVHCVDTVAKKAMFIRQVAAELGLAGLEAHHSRVEDLSAPLFPLITSRAFASLADFVSLTHPLLAPGGAWAAMKARLSESERNELPASVCIESIEALQVPGLDAARCLVWLGRSGVQQNA